ncbi:branched-chain amino acid aminotransferase [Psychrobacillus sp.]|uniref:branched-chain amino acid aminotransferase n=1 Tax=Psychrobacillus sp. TaxID=1871623 RepID=UPI0028BDC0E4|nr:branched-chain amino acid aminotransferase [Psychrobacillus sp.]
MITKRLAQKLANASNKEVSLSLEEKVYAEKHQLLVDGLTVIEIEKNNQFKDAIIERFHKETEELISEDKADFLTKPLAHLKENMHEFIYLESSSFDTIGVDAIAIEYDEVFEVYTAMFGLALQKKFASAMKTFLDEHFNSEKMNYSMMFSGEDGLWEVNLPLNYFNHFEENSTIEETYHFLYTLIFSLGEAVEQLS